MTKEETEILGEDLYNATEVLANGGFNEWVEYVAKLVDVLKRSGHFEIKEI